MHSIIVDVIAHACGGTLPETGVIPGKAAVVIGSHRSSAKEFPKRNPIAPRHHAIYYRIDCAENKFNFVFKCVEKKLSIYHET